MILIYPQNWINKPYHPIKKIQGAPFSYYQKRVLNSNKNNQCLLQLRISFQAKKPCWAQHPTWSKRSLQQYLFLRWLAQCSASWGGSKNRGEGHGSVCMSDWKGMIYIYNPMTWGDLDPSILRILGGVWIRRVYPFWRRYLRGGRLCGQRLLGFWDLGMRWGSDDKMSWRREGVCRCNKNLRKHS